MLLEVSCTVNEYMDFLTQVSQAGVSIEFEMHGADEFSSFHVNGQYPSTELRPDDHLESSSIGKEEVIGNQSLNEYDENDLFMSSGKIYKALTKIYPNDILIEDGNCKKTTLNEELQLLKDRA